MRILTSTSEYSGDSRLGAGRGVGEDGAFLIAWRDLSIPVSCKKQSSQQENLTGKSSQLQMSSSTSQRCLLITQHHNTM